MRHRTKIQILKTSLLKLCNILARNVISLLTEPVKYFSYISSLVSQIVIEQIQFQEIQKEM